MIEGNRLVLGWNERLPSMSGSAAPYRGMATLVIDEEGFMVEYEGVFDTVAVIEALGA